MLRNQLSVQVTDACEVIFDFWAPGGSLSATKFVQAEDPADALVIKGIVLGLLDRLTACPEWHLAIIASYVLECLDYEVS